MAKKAVIDIGTNSVRMIIGELCNGKVVIHYKDIITTRLGEGVHRNRRLGARAIERTIETLVRFRERGLRYEVIDFLCFATSAVRDADNRDCFIRMVEERCNLKVVILSGEQEAMAAFLGATSDWSEDTEKSILLLDIGGGSTEAILGCANQSKWSVSMDIGAVRLTEMYPLCYPVNPIRWDAMVEYIDRVIALGMNHPFKDIGLLIGMGGTITSLAAIDQGMNTYDANRINGYCLTLERIEYILNRLAVLSPEERKTVAGIQPGRADIILAGVNILVRVMLFLNHNEIRVSDHDNLEGMLLLN